MASGSGLVMDWEQQSTTLLASGDVRTIRVWDMQRETKVQVSERDPFEWSFHASWVCRSKVVDA